MSSTVRVYVNDKRIATGKPWKNEFLQVYPEKKTFASEAEWRTSIYQSLVPTIRFVTTEAPVKVKPVVKPEVKAKEKPAPNPKEEDKPVDRNWICGYCRLPQGNDHRMCICHGYNYSVKAWENGRIYPNKNKETKSASVSEDKNDWDYQKTSKMSLPPGTYYVGDLCYALKDTLYDKVFGPQYRDGYYCSKSNPSDLFMMGGTGGDGEFRGTDGKMYPVDAGIIGIASESTLDKNKRFADCGSMYTFKGNVLVKFRQDKFEFSSDKYDDPYLTIYIYEDEYEDSE